MGIRIGVDVGGTFTKAVGYDLTAGAVCARAIVPTTHAHPDGVAAGVVQVVGSVAEQVGTDQVELVTHSTTQAVNALLEGDLATVGLIGLGRAPDLRKARKRTALRAVDLGNGHALEPLCDFLDVTNGLSDAQAAEVVERIRARGVTSLAVAGAFAPDDDVDETTVARVARAAGMPVTVSGDLSGLYGLELRAVTAALNAAILPVAIHTADVVAAGVASAGVRSPVMVMRGDGGATDLDGFRRAPARTLYSGPAASVAGALRVGRIDDGVVVEVGGTSTNVSVIRRGHPSLSYVKVGQHATAIRALDVRVLGVAGGSMLRVRRGRVYGVGPRSAHIAGCGYSCFTPVDDLEGATVEVVSPRPGDPADHVVLRLRNGSTATLTNTCAANLLGLVDEGDHARGDEQATRLAFTLVSATLGLTADELARRMLQASVTAVGEVVAGLCREYELERPVLVAVGGGAGGLGRAVATGMGLDVVVPDDAEIISAVGDALSVVRSEREHAMQDPSPADIEALVGAAELEVVNAGAAAGSVDVRVTHLPERGAVRVTATGSVGLTSGALPGRTPAGPEEANARAASRDLPAPRREGEFWVSSDAPEGRRVAIFDRYADLVAVLQGEVVPVGAAAEEVGDAVDRQTSRIGPLRVPPHAWVLAGPRVIHIPDCDSAAVVATVLGASARGADPVVIIGKD